MKKINYLFLYIIFVTSMIAQSKIDETIPVIHISDRLEEREIKLSDICSDILYTKLEFDKKYPVVLPNRSPYVTNDYIFFQSRSIILRYTQDGKKVVMIGSIGQGPGQYLNGSSYIIDAFNNKMYIQNNFTKDILVYDFIINKYLYKFILPFDIEASLLMAIDGFIGMVGETGRRYASTVRYFSLNFINSEGKVIFEKTNQKYIKPKSEHRWNGTYIIGGATNYWRVEGNSFCSIQEMGCDTIFSITKELKISPRFIINCSIRIFDENISDFYAESSNYLFWLMNNNNLKKQIRGFYDKTTGKSYIHSQHYWSDINKENRKSILGIQNDIDGGLPIIIPHKSHSATHWHIFVEPFELIEYVNSPEFKKTIVKDPQKKEALERFVKTLVEDDNPVLVTLTLK